MSNIKLPERCVLSFLDKQSLNGETATVAELSQIKSSCRLTDSEFKLGLMKLYQYKCVIIQPSPHKPEDIDNSHSIAITDTGRDACNITQNGNYCYPSLSNSSVNVNATYAQVGNYNTMNIQLQHLEHIVSELEKSNISQESKNNILKSIWGFIEPIVQGTSVDIIKQLLGLKA